MTVALIALALAGVSSTDAWVRIDTTTGVRLPAPVAQPPRPATIGSGRGGRSLNMPRNDIAGSATGFTPIRRAREVLDASQGAARSVAKLFRLDAQGTRTGEACTAEFVGERYLVTAAHCLVDRITGQPFKGFEIAALYDAGQAAGGVTRVVASWVRTAAVEPTTAINAMVTPDRCDDVALIEVADPLGRKTGWLGMNSVIGDAALIRFSYPHRSAITTLEAARDRPGTSPVVRAALDAEIARVRASEPAFSPDDLYVDGGHPTRLEASYVAEPSAQAIPGRSGSAMLDADGRIVSLMSRSYGGMTYSCRLTPDAIGMIQAIVSGVASRRR